MSDYRSAGGGDTMNGSTTYPTTASNQPSRHPERAAFDAATVHAILDEALISHVAFVADERPAVLPMLFVRIDRSVYLHGSTGSHIGRMAARRGSLPVAFEVTIVDEIVLARSTFNHSANYRSVVVHGDATVVREEERKSEILAALVERIVPGRSADARPPTAQELRQTVVLEVPLENVSAKVREGDPHDDADDLGSACWAGVRPLHTTWGEPRASGDLAEGIPVPDYLHPAGGVTLPA